MSLFICKFWYTYVCMSLYKSVYWLYCSLDRIAFDIINLRSPRDLKSILWRDSVPDSYFSELTYFSIQWDSR